MARRGEVVAEQCHEGYDTHKALTQVDEHGQQQHGVGMQMQDVQPIRLHHNNEEVGE